MKQTVEMLEDVAKHLRSILNDPTRSPEVHKAAKELLDYLKVDLAIAKKAAAADN
jgi:hypothetical protein